MIKKRLFIMFAMFLCAFGVAGGIASPSMADSPQGADKKCQDINLPVSLLPTDPTTYNVFGQLCWKGALAGKTVQLLTSGFTYDHTYWDFPLQPQRYSYVRATVDEGYATFNIDRIGLGQSDHPAGAGITVPSEAFMNHQIVQALRGGAVAGTPFDKVIAVGHSLGSGISIYEAATYADVDGVIVSGLLHALNPDAPNFFAQLHPAQLDPKFASAGLPPDYVTTQPGARAIFYNTLYADPAIIAKDETLKQTGTSGELATFGMGLDASISQQIHVPVLVVIGQDDQLFCNEALPGMSCADKAAVTARESSAYAPNACMQTYVLKRSGHDLNLHPDADQWFEQANDWITHHTHDVQTPGQSC